MEFKKALLALCNPRTKLLKKEIQKPTLDDENEKISVNLKFTNNNIRVNMTPVRSKKDTGDLNTELSKEINIGLEKDRSQKIDAAIVK